MQAIKHGIVVVDKPAGMTSAHVVAVVKRIFQSKKAGHCGTLDPEATGVLICCIGKATKLARFFLQGEKTYEAILRLGMETDTQDATGQVTARSAVVNFTADEIRSVFREFEGSVEQTPPAVSALKHNGTPLYKLARAGKPVQKPPRRIRISQLKILDMALPEVRFEITCSAGTYVRTLCADIGARLRCGGHLRELRRIRSSGFSLKEATTVSELKSMAGSDTLAAKIVPMAAALRQIPSFRANDRMIRKIRHGMALAPEELGMDAAAQRYGYFKVIDERGELLAVLERLKPDGRINYRGVFHS